MDINKLVEVLRATLDPEKQQEAERQLNEVHKIIGFAPSLLQVIMTDLDTPVRQAGVIYLKNMVTQFWHEREVSDTGEPVPFSIHEQDRAGIRDIIVEAIISAPDPIRVQLTVCISNILKHDYPGRWPGVAEKIAMYIQQNDNSGMWLGALMCLHQLVKNFEFKKAEDRTTLNMAMQHLLPLILQRCIGLKDDDSEYSVMVQKQILKIFHALIQFHLPMDLVPKDSFKHWMELMWQIVARPVPDVVNQVDEEERQDLVWWKVKKWALHILTRTFERYGSPGNVLKEYKEFSEWYLKQFSGMTIQVLITLLMTEVSDGILQYVSPRVTQLSLNYLNQGVSHSHSWKFMKQHMHAIIQKLLFPLMCHTEQDDEIWESDPHEYIRMKYDVFEDFFSPVTAAQNLLHTSVSKRKDILPKTVGFCMQILTTPNIDAKEKDGALHMIGSMGDILLKRKPYKDQIELMLTSHVYPEFTSEHGFLRGRACWTLCHFSEIKFKNDTNLAHALEYTKKCLCEDKDLPVRVEAAIAIQMIVTNQDKARNFVQPHIKPIILELLKIIRETENDDLTTVMQKLVCTYVEDIVPIAVEITSHLAQTFAQVLESDTDGSDEKAIAAMGLLNTIDTILTVMEEQKEIMVELEGIVLNVIGIILHQNVLEFYEEVLSLTYSLTCQQISQHMWQVFFMIFEMFKKDGFDYFTDMMPALHNYITIDPQAFLSNPQHLEIIYTMCKGVLESDAGDDAECHAAKLLEVILLQYKGQVDNVVESFVKLALERLTKEVKTSELRTMCLQVVIAALYYNTPLLLEILEKTFLPNTNEAVTAHFLKHWLDDTNCFLGLHDRKIAVLGLCALMSTPANRPNAITQAANEILPSAIMLFDGLKRAYAVRASENADDDDDDEEEDDGEFADGAVLDDDEDDIDEEGAEYMEKMERANGEDDDSDDEDEFSDDELEETVLESYNTPLDEESCGIDEYQIFQQILMGCQQSDPQWYNLLIANLTQEQNKKIEDIFTLAEQRKAAEESKRIDAAGGYSFTTHQVPQTFAFGGN